MNFLSQNYIKYPLLMCAIVVVNLTMMELTGQNQTFEKPPLFGLFMVSVPIIIWFLGIRAKKKLLKGKMTFMQGFVEGLKISLAYAIISPFIFLFYYTLVNPDILEFVKKAYNMQGASDSKAMYTDLTVQFFSSLTFGLIISPIISFFLRSKKK